MSVPLKTCVHISIFFRYLTVLTLLSGTIETSSAQPLDFKASISNSTPVNGDEITVRFEAGSPTDLFSIAFDVDYAPGIFDYIDCTEGTVLNSGASTTFLTSVNATAGKIIIAISRLNPAPTVSYTGYRTSVTLRFRVVTIGSFSFTISNAGFMDNNSSPLDFTQTNIPVTGSVNHPPAFSPDLPATFSLNEDIPEQFDLAAYFSDVENDVSGTPLIATIDPATINTVLLQSAVFSGLTLLLTPADNASGNDAITRNTCRKR